MLNYNHKALVFKDVELQHQLNNNGFAIVDFLNNEEVTHLINEYNQKHTQGVNGFYTSTFSTDKQYRKDVDVMIQQQMQRGLQHYFFDYKIHCGSYIVKGADERSKLKMHQDMTLVDESIYTGINIWIPLIDLTTENGAIEIVPKSHRLFKTYRGASLPDIYDGIESEVHKLMQPQYLKAGQAIIFDQSIIHYSPANRSSSVRPVINTFITHKDANIQIYYWDKNERNEIEVFHQAPDFMTNFDNFGHDIFSRPKVGQSGGFVKYDFPKITLELLQQEYNLQEDKKTKKKNFFQRLFNYEW